MISLLSLQSMLLPLVKEEDAHFRDTKKAVDLSKVDITVYGVWQRIYQSKWCLGADIICKTKR